MPADIPPNPSTIVYTTRFYRLVDLLRDERVVEPRLNPDSDLEWLAWAHGARWLIVRAFFRLVLHVSPTFLRSTQRMLFDSRSRAVAHGDASLPLVRRYSDVQDLIEYIDQVFLTLPSQHSYVGEPYPLIAWAPNRVAAEQSDAEVGRPLLPIRYMERPMQLSSFRASSDSLDGLLTCRIECEEPDDSFFVTRCNIKLPVVRKQEIRRGNASRVNIFGNDNKLERILL